MTHRGPFQPLLFCVILCDSLSQNISLVLVFLQIPLICDNPKKKGKQRIKKEGKKGSLFWIRAKWSLVLIHMLKET